MRGGVAGLWRWLALAVLGTVLASCIRLIPPAPPIAGGAATNAFAAGLRPGPAISKLNFSDSDARGALAAFRLSCPKLITRTDQSGLTRPDDWKGACEAATRWPETRAKRFFDTWFEAVQVGDGKAFVTGYYEPAISGVRTRRSGFDVPVYGLPRDLVRAKVGDAPPTEKGGQPLGRYDASGKFVPYHDRADIEDGALMGRGLEIGWAADPVELFFLQVQGSGRLIAPDGTQLRIGYAGQNGHPYTGIGGVMRQRGLLGTGPGQYSGSMQGIMQYIRENPEQGRALMRENKSYVFFQELKGDGPLGFLGVPVRARDSVAVDPMFVPLGAPVFLTLDRSEADGLWIAQDTGGAIKGANRFDSFWGFGAEARVTAGGMSGRGDAVLLLPKGTLTRLSSPQ
ncbi:MAG: murein transglycosylase A [Novosphingobium sp.]|uniref:murein transglycosylase A n=1 Tax=Novosphingobium sp. TaxID=1874826 RepID=UPI0032BBD6ED